jgi:hypothetical protein
MICDRVNDKDELDVERNPVAEGQRQHVWHVNRF